MEIYEKYLTEEKMDADFISSVAKDMGVSKKLSPEDIKRAHKFADRYKDPQDYYDALKEFFNN